MNQWLLALNLELEQTSASLTNDLAFSRSSLVLALTELASNRDAETGAHLLRVRRYCRRLADELAVMPSIGTPVSDEFVELLNAVPPLHDIGKVDLPDHSLLKPGKLDGSERLIMQSHAVMGAEILRKVAEERGLAPSFSEMAIQVTRHHHERVDGNGYADRLAGDDIPLAARILAVADVYDALRSRRTYKPAVTYLTVVEWIVEGSSGQFDPRILAALQRCASDLDRAFVEIPENRQPLR